jgi:hypothetical protein
MRPTPPSPSQNDGQPDQSNGHAHGDGTAVNGSTPTNTNTNLPLRPAATAAAQPSDDRNNAMDETDESGNVYRSSPPSDSPNGTPFTPSNLLSRQLRRGAVAVPWRAWVAEGGNNTTHPPPPPSGVFPTTESLFRHAVPSSDTTALTATNLVAALERRYPTPANPDDAGTRTPSTATTGLTSSPEGWERVMRSRGPTPGSVMGQQGSVEEEEGEQEQQEDRNGTSASSTPPNATTPARRVYATADLHEIAQKTADSTVTPSSPTDGWRLVSASGPRGRGRGRPTRGDYRNANLDGSSDIKDDATPVTVPEHSDAEHDLEEGADGSENGSYGDLPYTGAGGLPSSSAAASSGSAQQPSSSGSAQQQPENSSQDQGSSQDIEPYRRHDEAPSSSAAARSGSAPQQGSSGSAQQPSSSGSAQQPSSSESAQQPVSSSQRRGRGGRGRPRHDSTDERHEFDDDKPLVLSPSSSQEEVGDEFNEDPDPDAQEHDYDSTPPPTQQSRGEDD